MSEVLRSRRAELGLSQVELARAAGIGVRQIARYEAGEQQPVLSVAAALADALDVSLNRLAGREPEGLDLTGDWFASWETSKDGVPRVDTHTMEITQRGDRLYVDATRARDIEEGSYAWRGEFRLWDNEALIGWYRSTEQAVRSKGSMYLALHPHGIHAWGRWVGMSYDGAVITGWASISRDHDDCQRIVQSLIETNGASNGTTR